MGRLHEKAQAVLRLMQKPRMNTNHCFLALDRHIEGARSWLRERTLDACGYSSAILIDRLVQRLIEICLKPYTLAISSTSLLPSPGTQVNCGRASIEIGSGKIKLTLRQWLTNQIDFFLHWAFCLTAILTIKKAGNSSSPAVLVFGVGEESLLVNNDDTQFVSYCRTGPISPLRNGRRFLIQSSTLNISSNPSEFEYCKRPLITLLRGSQLGLYGRLRLLADHLVLLFSYFSHAVRMPPLSLLGKDFAYSRISFELDRRGLMESIILTCAHHAAQQLWTRALSRAKVHMIWYSQVAKPFVFAFDKLSSDVPSYRWIKADTHWVWTEAFAQFLRNLVQAEMRVVGPIVWYKPEILLPAKDTIAVAIFDVSPYVDDVALCYGEFPNYNNPRNLLLFIDDVITLKDRLETIFRLSVSLRLKTKRGYAAAYDKGYFEYIEKLHSAGIISLEHHTSNIFSLISSSHLVIAYPFTSAAYVAEFLRVPAVYYDPTKSIVRHDFSDSKSYVEFAGCLDELMNASKAALSRVFPARTKL